MIGDWWLVIGEWRVESGEWRLGIGEWFPRLRDALTRGLVIGELCLGKG